MAHTCQISLSNFFLPCLDFCYCHHTTYLTLHHSGSACHNRDDLHGLTFSMFLILASGFSPMYCFTMVHYASRRYAKTVLGTGERLMGALCIAHGACWLKGTG
jgi:hypothetical protein